MWHYGKSLEISQKPPEMNEFSQQLRVRIEIQDEQFPNKPIKSANKWTIEFKGIDDHVARLRLQKAKKYVIVRVRILNTNYQYF
jgi:hypothetical protein